MLIYERHRTKGLVDRHLSNLIIMREGENQQSSVKC
nr:MAG TPA: Phosphatidylinositol 3- and 4-kinase [Bacteriophage sp.]